MSILVKNKETLIFDEFKFKCSLGKRGITKNKLEGDKKTPRGIYDLGNLYYRNDKNQKPKTKIKCIPISKKMGWCDDVHNKKKDEVTEFLNSLEDDDDVQNVFSNVNLEVN